MTNVTNRGALIASKRQEGARMGVRSRMVGSLTTGLGADLKGALRVCRSEPGFAAVAIGVLAVGIGVAAAIFSVADAVVLRRLPFAQPDRLVALVEHDTKRPETFGGGRTTPPTFLDWRRYQTSFEGLAAVTAKALRTHTPSGEPVETPAHAVTWEFFPVLRARPLLGRLLGPGDEVTGRHRVTVLSYAFWQRQFGGARDVVGRLLDVNEERWEVVGVLPPAFSDPIAGSRAPDLYVPFVVDAAERSRAAGYAYTCHAIGRLKPGISLARAGDEMARLAAALERQNPGWAPDRMVQVVSLQDQVVGRAKPWMLMLLWAVVLVLLIACANVANLLLARATTRGRDTAIRAALGASRWRLVRKPLVEGLVLAASGAAGGVLLACALIPVLRRWLPFDLPRISDIGMDWRLLGAAAAAAVLTGAVSGLIPGLANLRWNRPTLDRDEGRPGTVRAAGRRLRGALVTAEIALAVVLLIGAALFTRSFVNLVRIDPGFDTDRVLALRVGLPVSLSKVDGDRLERSRRYIAQALDAVRQVPGVEMAGSVAGGLPLTGDWNRSSVELPGRGELTSRDSDIDVRAVSPDYLKILRVPLLRGRHLSDDDRSSTTPVVVINQAAARTYWPGSNALGQRITINDRERLVVGIVGDIRHLGPERPPRQEAYLPATQKASLGATLVMRTNRSPLEVLPGVKAAIRTINPEQRFPAEVVTLDGYMDRLVAHRRFTMAVTVLLGLLALVIACAGVYGVMAYVVAQRQSEIGVRMALGATPGSVLGMVMREASALVVRGMAIGGLLAWQLGATIQVFLFGVRADDAATCAAAVALLAVAAFVASVVPARRAAMLDPLVALRRD